MTSRRRPPNALRDPRRRPARRRRRHDDDPRARERGGRDRPAADRAPARTELFIHPGHQFRVVDALLTNFHLPRSSLLMLVAAFAGRELILDAYRDAVARGFRFYSYGDAMLVVDGACFPQVGPESVSEVTQPTSGTESARPVEKCPVPMKLDYEDFDLSGVRTYPLAARPSKVHHENFAKRWAPDSGFAGWLASLPRILAAADLQAVIAAIQQAHADGRGDRLGPRRARDQDRPGARDHRSDGARLRLGDRAQRRGPDPRLRDRARGPDLRGRRRDPGSRHVRHGGGNRPPAERRDSRRREPRARARPVGRRIPRSPRRRHSRG